MDTKYEANIKCPYCGWEDRDSWESGDSGEMECGRCDKEFTFEREVEVTYSTWKSPEDCDHADQKIYCDYCAKHLEDKS